MNKLIAWLTHPPVDGTRTTLLPRLMLNALLLRRWKEMRVPETPRTAGSMSLSPAD